MSKKHGVVRDMEQDSLDLMVDDLFEREERNEEIIEEYEQQTDNNIEGSDTSDNTSTEI